MFKDYILINENGDGLVSYSPGKIEMLSKKGFKLDGQVAYYEREILKTTYRKALKLLSQITSEGIEIFIYKRRYKNVYYHFLGINPKSRLDLIGRVV